MSQHVFMRSACGRSLMVTATVAFTLIVSAGVSAASEVSSAGAASAGTDGALGLGVAKSTVVLGMSVGTLAWVSIGLVLLVVGFVSASKPGQRSQHRTVPAVAVAGQMHESSGVPAQSQGDLMKATLAVS